MFACPSYGIGRKAACHDTKFILPSAPSINVTSVSSLIQALTKTSTAGATDKEASPKKRPAGARLPARFDIRGERGPHVAFETLTQQHSDKEGMLRSRDFFLSLVRDEVDKHAVPASQSVMALLTGLRGDLQLEGVFCLSGYLPLADSVRESGGGGGGKGADKFPHVREGTGMKANGEKDHIMKLDWVDKSRNIVKELGYPVDSSIIPIDQEVLEQVAAFIMKIQGKGRREHDEL
ncbi:hypothetical protein F5883DRAFT_648218 [Diaporthe sp. PMI_573]|nr:hypothetical protein F5883DRAFT_648218 [Diaporthaceae sp. PMI_573]